MKQHSMSHALALQLADVSLPQHNCVCRRVKGFGKVQYKWRFQTVDTSWHLSCLSLSRDIIVLKEFFLTWSCIWPDSPHSYWVMLPYRLFMPWQQNPYPFPVFLLVQRPVGIRFLYRRSGSSSRCRTWKTWEWKRSTCKKVQERVQGIQLCFSNQQSSRFRSSVSRWLPAEVGRGICSWWWLIRPSSGRSLVEEDFFFFFFLHYTSTSKQLFSPSVWPVCIKCCPHSCTYTPLWNSRSF